MGVAIMRIRDLYIITLHFQLFRVREQMVIATSVNYDGAPVGLRRRGREVSSVHHPYACYMRL
jgi:hypothetical protein